MRVLKSGTKVYNKGVLNKNMSKCGVLNRVYILHGASTSFYLVPPASMFVSL